MEAKVSVTSVRVMGSDGFASEGRGRVARAAIEVVRTVCVRMARRVARNSVLLVGREVVRDMDVVADGLTKPFVGWGVHSKMNRGTRK